jgi:hypothetical protein
MTERTLTRRELNRALLARQLLLERSRKPLVAAIEQVAGLQMQYAPSAYIGLWSRLERFGLTDLTRALEWRRAVQATLMRSTIHLVSAGDYWLFADGIRDDRREWWERVHRRHVGDVDMDEAVSLVRNALSDESPRRRNELVELLRPLDPRRGTLVWNGLPLDLVRVPPSGTWERRRADLYGLAESWLGPSSGTKAQGLDHLLRRYLAGFGPARLNDAADWAGVNVTSLKPSAGRLRLRRFRDEEGKELLDLPRATLPGADVPAPVRFIPTWDEILLVHARRTLVLPERFRPLIFNTKMPQSTPTFAVDGAVAGKWRIERTQAKATLVLEPFEPLPRTAVAELRSEAEQLVRFHEPDAGSHRVKT